MLLAEIYSPHFSVLFSSSIMSLAITRRDLPGVFDLFTIAQPSNPVGNIQHIREYLCRTALLKKFEVTVLWHRHYGLLHHLLISSEPS